MCTPALYVNLRQLWPLLSTYVHTFNFKGKLSMSWVHSLSCPTLCKPMDCSTWDFPVHHQLPELIQTHVHWVGDGCYSTISSSVILFSSCLQSFPPSWSFQMIKFFTWGGQSIGVSTSTSVLPTNIHNWSPLGWTGWISLQSKGLSRVFFKTTVQKHQFFSTQLSL